MDPFEKKLAKRRRYLRADGDRNAVRSIDEAAAASQSSQLAQDARFTPKTAADIASQLPVFQYHTDPVDGGEDNGAGALPAASAFNLKKVALIGGIAVVLIGVTAVIIKRHRQAKK